MFNRSRKTPVGGKQRQEKDAPYPNKVLTYRHGSNLGSDDPLVLPRNWRPSLHKLEHNDTCGSGALHCVPSVCLSLLSANGEGLLQIYVAIERAGLTLTLSGGEAPYRDPNCRRY